MDQTKRQAKIDFILQKQYIVFVFNEIEIVFFMK